MTADSFTQKDITKLMLWILNNKDVDQLMRKQVTSSLPQRVLFITTTRVVWE